MTTKKNMFLALAMTASVALAFTLRAGTAAPKYWYEFNGSIVSRGTSSLSWNLDGSYTFPEVRQGSASWQVSTSGTSGQSVFAPANSSFTIFMSVNPGSNGCRNIFTLGANGDGVNLGIVTLYGGRLGVTCWDADHSANGKRQYGIIAADGVAGRLHPYALVYDSQSGKLTLYSNGIKVGSTDFGGFGGDAGSVTSFQFGSVYGGVVQPFGFVSGAILEDFKFFDSALSEEDVQKLCVEHPSQWDNPAAVETVGRVPAYWYTFNGAVKSRGADDLLENENYYAAHKVPTVSSFQAVTATRQGGVNPSGYGSWFNHGDIDGSSSFTVCYTGTLGSNDRGVLFAIGSGESSSNIALCRKSDSSVMVVRWDAASSYEEIVSAPVVKAGDYSHPYCIRYLANQKKLELYVDGLKWGEGTFNGLTGTCPYQIGSVYGGNYHGLATVGSPVWEDFRFYREALPVDEIAYVAQAMPCSWSKWVPYDIAVIPTYWYTFNSECVRQGSDYLRTGYDWEPHGLLTSTDYAFARKGSQAAGTLLTDTGKGPNGYGFNQVADGLFCLFFSARVKPVDKGVLLTIGAATSSANLGFVSAADGSIAVRTWKDGVTKNILTASVGDAGENYHAYAVVWNGTGLTLYLDGEAVQSTTDFDPDFVSANWQFYGTHGGGFGGDKNGVMLLEDFRFYKQALSAEQVAILSGRYAKWPNGASHVWNGGSTGTWDLTTANWLVWDVANWTQQSVAFSANGTALFDVPVSSLDAGAGVGASKVRFASDVGLSFGNQTAVACGVVTVDDGISVCPVGVNGLIRPGVRLFTGVTTANVPTASDAWGNAYYLSGTTLLYGREQKGFLLLFR